MLFLSHRDVAAALSVDDCRRAVAEALAEFSAGDAVQPLRQFLTTPAGGHLGVMPAALADGTSGVKAITVFPDNHTRGLPSHHGLVVLFDPASGAPTALLDAGALTALRTAAASAVATDLLARTGARRLTILGAGVQARSHLDAMLAIRPIERIRLWNRSSAAAERLAEYARDGGRSVRVCESARDAVSGAEIVCTVTASRTPVVRGAWLAPGAHVNAVGSYQPDSRELDTEAMRRATVWVDSREAALCEAGELIQAIAAGAINAAAIAGEIGELVANPGLFERDEDEITVFKSLGMAVEDVAAARETVRRARQRGLGLDLAGSAPQRASSDPNR